MKKVVWLIIFVFVLYGVGIVYSDTYKTENKSDRIKYLNKYGWVVDEKFEEEAGIEFPKKFNSVYLRYNEIQKKAGFDILPYAGEKATRYTYKVLNHKKGVEVYANLFISKDKVIAADIMSRNLGGFMHEINRKDFIN